MLKDRDATVTIPVKDIAVARKFYDETVGLERAASAQPDVLTYKSGKSTVMIYESQFAGTNKATAATGMIERDLDGVVADLKSRGVTFEHYDMPGVTREGDIHLTGMSRAAWFKDPDGNILALVGP